MTQGSHSARREQIEKKLLAEYGAVIGGSALHRLLGYRTGDAFRQAARRGRLVIPTFFIEGRRWRFAATSDVADWMASLGDGSASEP